MSGPSTLRLCFAAMAPALTEAASGRLKLQNPGSKNIDSRTLQGDCSATSPKADRLSPLKKNVDKEPSPSCDIIKSDDIVDLTNGTYCDTVVRSSPKGKGGGLNLTSSVVPTTEKNKNNSPAVNIGHLSSLSAAGKQFTFVDGVGEDLKTNGFLEGLKRMNQPYFVSNKKDQSVEDKNHFNSSDTLRILASKVVSQAGMVNGDNVSDRSKEDEQQSVKKSCVIEGGDARVGVSVKDNKNNIKNKVPEHKKVAPKFTVPVESEIRGTDKTMGVCEKDRITLYTKLEKQLESSLLTKPCEMEKPCDNVRKECVKKQAYLERKVEMLVRRLKRVKGKVVENHTKEQLAQYVNFQHRNLQMVAKSIKSEAPCPEVLKEHFLSNEDVKNMSTSQLVKLVRDNQSNKSLPVTDNARYRMLNSSASVMSPNLQRQSLSTSEKLSLRVEAVEHDLDSDATASSSGGESCDEEPTCSPKDTPLPSILKRAEWKWASDRAAIVSRWTWLQAQVSDLEYKIRQQSQVHRQLRNSKGGVVLGDPPTAIDILRKLQGFKPTPVSSFTSESATTDARNAGISGSSSTEVSPYNVTRLLSNVDKQASRLTQSLNCISPSSSTKSSPGAATKILSPVPNHTVADSPSSNSVGSEFTEITADNSPLITVSSSSSLPNFSQLQQSVPETSLNSSYSSLSTSSSVLDASFQAARCRPLRSYRKRKILRTIDLYKASVKAARLSDVRCKCYPPSNPCALCGGRYNNTMSMDADHMSFNERVALLDASFHPVLSFPQDIPLSIHCEGFLKSGLWQNKPTSRRSKAGDIRRQKVMSFAVPQSVAVKKSLSSDNNPKISSSGPSVINFTTKIKNKYEGKTKVKKTQAIPRSTPLKHKVNKVKKKAAKLSKAMKKKKERENEADDLETMYLEQEVNCPSSSTNDRLSNSASGSGVRDSQRRRRVDNAFDINNIEIPHSIAASTRVEQIRYKEIVTPKWRVVEDDSSESPAEEDSSPSVPTPPSIQQSPLEPLIAAAAGKVLEKANGVSVSLEHHLVKPAEANDVLEQDQETEDLTDEAYLRRHALPEQEERKRFRNFLQYPPIRRSRTRSDAFPTNNNTTLTNNNTTLINNDASVSNNTSVTDISSITNNTPITSNNISLTNPTITSSSGNVLTTALNNSTSTTINNSTSTTINNSTTTTINSTSTTINSSTTATTINSTTHTTNNSTSTTINNSTTSNIVNDRGEDYVPNEVDGDIGESGDTPVLNRSLPALPLADETVEWQQPTARRRSMLESKRDRTMSTGLSEALPILPSSDFNSVDPWPRRAFPLPEEEYTRMQSESSSSSSNCEPLHQEVDRPVTTEPSGKVYVGDRGFRSGSMDIPDESSSRVPSPHPSLESTSSSLGEDPADPDWVTNVYDPSTKTAPRHRRASHTNPNIADPDWNGSDNPRRGKKR